jgi:hypothetical protein
MKARKIFTYDNPLYKPLEKLARDVVAAYQDGARWLDTIQEWVLTESAMPFTARHIHDLAHEMPKRFDVFNDMMHERHLMAVYPPTAELTEKIEDMDKAFELVIAALDNIQAALWAFFEATDNEQFKPMALKAEELMLQNSGDYTEILQMWFMWDESTSKTSFDAWARTYSRKGA